MTAIGIAAGVGGAMWLTRYLRTQLYAASPLDPSVYVTVAALLASVAIVACLIPAQFETLQVEVRGQPNRIDLLQAPQYRSVDATNNHAQAFVPQAFVPLAPLVSVGIYSAEPAWPVEVLLDQPGTIRIHAARVGKGNE